MVIFLSGVVSGPKGKGPRASHSKRRGNIGGEVPNKFQAKISTNDDSDVIPESDTEVEMERNKGNVL